MNRPEPSHLPKPPSKPMARLAAAALVVLALCLAGAPAPSHAQDEAPLSESYLTPFPEGDIYRLRVVGDSLADGVLDALAEGLGREGRVDVNRRRWTLNRLARPDYAEELKALRGDLVSEQSHIAVVLVGAQDRRALRDARGRRLAADTPEWRTEYARRIDTAMKELKRASVAVYWIGLPVMRRPEDDEEARVSNEVLRERAYMNNIRYIDVSAAFTEEGGAYSAYGPDLTGKIRLLRERDGVHFTWAGSQKLAHFIEREIKRDVAAAKQERNLPLAGSEAEQKRIAAATRGNNSETVTGWRASIAAAKAKAAQRSGAGAFVNLTGGEQKADNSRINLKTVGPGGREQIVALDILRPAIPASVVALVTRQQSPDRAAQLGDTLVDQITGGLNILSTVTPPAEAGPGASGRKLSPAMTPFFRVLVKGERLAPQAGRADDFSWPRPPPPVIERVRAPVADGEESDGGIPLPAVNPFRPRA